MKYLIIACVSILPVILNAQDTTYISLSQAIEIVQENSNLAKRIKHEYNSSLWNYKIYRAAVLPTIDLMGTLPDFNRSISPQLLPDGTQDFIAYNNWNSDMGLRITQPITMTGGQLYINSNIKRIINVELEENGTAYYTNPITIGFNQELTGFNEFRWQRKIEPLKLQEAKKDKLEQIENLSIKVVETFFKLMISQDRLKSAQFNLKNNQELYRMSKGRFNLGKIAENELLQIELNKLQAESSVENFIIELQRSENEFKTLLKVSGDQQIILLIPEEIKDITVNPDHAVQQAFENRKDVIGFKRKQLEAEMKLAEARASKRPQLNLFGSFGLNQSGNTLEGAYKDPLDQERFNLGLQIPIYDGSSNRSQFKIAQSNLDLTTSELEDEREVFERDVRMKVQEVNLLDLQLEIAQKADLIASKSYEISRARYKQGKINIIELGLSQKAKDQSRISYLSSIKNYWTSYFELRQLTLYDYVENVKIVD